MLEDEHLALYGEDWRVTASDILDSAAIAQRCSTVFGNTFNVPDRHQVDRRGEITGIVRNLNALIERDAPLIQNLCEDIADVRERNRRILENICGDALAKYGERGWEVRPSQVRDVAGLARQWRRSVESAKKEPPNKLEKQLGSIRRTLEQKLPESIAKHLQSDEAEDQLPDWLCHSGRKSPDECRRQTAKGLNDLIRGENLITDVYPNLLKHIAVTTRQLLTQAELTAEERAYLNRRILDDVFGGYIQRGEEARLAKIYEVIHAADQTSALCISGGGIRSATFGLGILQGLSRRNLLHRFDYISTVSGGGYIGSWLSSWMRRHGQGARGVAEDLAKPPVDRLDTEPEPVDHLREFSNYLTPRLGVLSGDTLAVAAVYVRNLLLNWTILVPLLIAALVLPRIVHAIYFRSLSHDVATSLDTLAATIVGGATLATFGHEKLKWLDDRLVNAATWTGERLVGLADLIEVGSSFFLIRWMRGMGLFEHTAAWFGGASLLCAVLYLGLKRPTVNRFGEVRAEKVQRNFMLFCLLPFITACVALTAAWARLTMAGRDAIPLAGFVIFGAVPVVAGLIYLISYARASASDRRESLLASTLRKEKTFRKKVWREFLAASAASIVSAVLVWLVAAYIFPHPYDPVTVETFPSPILALHERIPVSAFYVCFAVPLLLGVFLIAATVFVGVSSAVNEDYDREWWARCMGYALGAIAIWILVTSVVIFGPVALHFAPRAIGAVGGVAGIVSVVLGRSQKTGGKEGEEKTWSDIIAAWAAPVFILFLLAVGSLVTSKLFAPDQKIGAASASMLEKMRWSAQQKSNATAASMQMAGFRQQAVDTVGANAVPALGGAKVEVTTAIEGRRAFDSARYGAWKHQLSVFDSKLPPLAVFFGLLVALAAVAARSVNVNKFSMHSLYRNRLIRAYLGASRSTRDPHPFTGFDPQDNIEMQQLRPEMLWASSFRDLGGVIAWLTGNVEAKPDEKAKKDFAENLRRKMDRVQPSLFERTDRPEFDSELFQVLNCVLETDDLEKPEERGRRTSLWNVKAYIADRKTRSKKPALQPEEIKSDPRRLRRNRETLDRHFAREIYPYDAPLLRRGDIANYEALAQRLRAPRITDTEQTPAMLSPALAWLREKLEPHRGALEKCAATEKYLHAALETVVGELNRVITECDLQSLKDLGAAAYPIDYQRVRRNRKILDRELAGAIHPLTTPRTMHVVNVALNLVSGEKLGWQERKAQSFTITSMHSGGFNVGYRQSTHYGGGITLGTAVTISGAAVSPNMGYHSSAPLAFLLTLFNVRLGWWLGNPGPFGGDTWTDDCPKLALRPLLAELSGSTNECFPYVYLSDGGHFENLGLYEMVLRRRRYIMVSDAGCDPTHAFEDLGNAIRKIRTDLGVPIEIKHMSLYPRPEKGVDPKVGRYCAVGRIRYSCVDPYGEDGWLLYVKPTVYMIEPRDIYNYARSSAAFPHESTADQWFSESQFESYRMLGSHAVDRVCMGAADDCDTVEAQTAAQNWIPPSFEEFFRVAQEHAEKEAAAEKATSPSAGTEQPRSRTRGRSKPDSAPSR